MSLRLRRSPLPSARRPWGRGGIVVLISILAFVVSADIAFAGFGITPPYVRNERLTPGSTFEQEIVLVRSDPVDDLQVTITMNIPGIEHWFSIDRGMSFVLPKGETQVPIKVTVRVPEDAAYEPHKGAIRIRTSAAGSEAQGGGVSIALGAQVDVSIAVVDKIYDFVVRKIRVTDLEEGRQKWGLFFPAKIRFFMTIENTGNTDFGPTKVRFEIYDSDGDQLLEATENTNDIATISPFGTQEVLAELPTRLPAGRYLAKYSVYKNEEIAQQNSVTLSINPIGTVPGYEGYGFDGLSLRDTLKVALAIGIPLMSLVALFGFVYWKRRSRSLPSRIDLTQTGRW